MVLLRGFVATPSGARPTGIAAVTLICAATVGGMFHAGRPDAAAPAAAEDEIAAIATEIRTTARWVRPMMSYFLASNADKSSRAPGGAPSVLTLGHAELLLLLWLRFCSN